VGARGRQFAKIGNLSGGMHQEKTLGLVWSDIAQQGGILHQNWRIERNPVAKAAFRLAVSTLRLTRPSQ
jgi:hypothetical protein